MLDQPAAVREPLEIDRLTHYLQDQLDLDGPWTVQQFPHGYSNLTYWISNGENQMVLRRPPYGNQVKSAHDMGREFRILSKLCDIYPAAPRPLAYCQDSDVLGAEFYLLQRRQGVILRGAQPPPALATDAALARRLSESFIDNLARLHTLDYQQAGLANLGRPAGYVARQVNGWIQRYENAATQSLPALQQLSTWLRENQPDDDRAAVIHNDYKYDNLMLHPDDLPQIVAVLDWEMATVGHPFMDLGTALAYWVEARDEPSLRRLAFGPTMTPGSLSRRELLQRYCQRTGWDVPLPLFYYGFGMFKLAAIVQQIYARYAGGHTQDDRFAHLDQTVALLGQAALRAISKNCMSDA